MPIHRLLKDSAFSPEEVEFLVRVFEDVSSALGLAPRVDPLRELVARTVFEIARGGERDPVRLRERALEALKK